MSFDLLGAGEGLSKQYITLQVKSVDVDKLSQKLGGAKGTAVASAMPLIDMAPGIALKAALPFAQNLVKNDYGIDLDYQVTDVVPPKQSGNGEFGDGVMAGLVLAAMGFVGWKIFKK